MLDALAEEQDFFLGFDDEGSARRSQEYARRYAAMLLRRSKRRNGVLLVAIAGHKLAGLVAAELVPWQPSFAVDPAHPEVSKEYRPGEITELYVRAAYRRRGLGRALVLEAERRLRAQGCRWIRLEVFAPNRAARRFYAQLGYVPRDLRLGKPL